jgi:hypothetical protein
MTNLDPRSRLGAVDRARRAPVRPETNPMLADNARYRIGEVLADHHREHDPLGSA